MLPTCVSVAQWESIGLMSQKSGVQIPLLAKVFVCVYIGTGVGESSKILLRRFDGSCLRDVLDQVLCLLFVTCGRKEHLLRRAGAGCLQSLDILKNKRL